MPSCGPSSTRSRPARRPGPRPPGGAGADQAGPQGASRAGLRSRRVAGTGRRRTAGAGGCGARLRGACVGVNKRIVVLPGDGIGPEVVEAAVSVLTAVAARYRSPVRARARRDRRRGVRQSATSLPQATLERLPRRGRGAARRGRRPGVRLGPSRAAPRVRAADAPEGPRRVCQPAARETLAGPRGRRARSSRSASPARTCASSAS